MNDIFDQKRKKEGNYGFVDSLEHFRTVLEKGETEDFFIVTISKDNVMDTITTTSNDIKVLGMLERAKIQAVFDEED